MTVMTATERLSALTPEARAEIERELQATITLAREKARRRRFDWHTLDLGRYRVALRVQRRLTWPLQILLTAKQPLTPADVEALASLAGIRYFSTDHFPGNQMLITEHRLKPEAHRATVQPDNRPAGATPSA